MLPEDWTIRVNKMYLKVAPPMGEPNEDA